MRDFRDIRVLICVGVLYLSNMWVKTRVHVVFIQWYLNDVLAGIGIIAYLHYILSFAVKRKVTLRLPAVLLFELFCGLVWEYAAPDYKTTAVADPWDIAAYLAGGMIYWLLFIKNEHQNIRKVLRIAFYVKNKAVTNCLK